MQMQTKNNSPVKDDYYKRSLITFTIIFLLFLHPFFFVPPYPKSIFCPGTEEAQKLYLTSAWLIMQGY